MVVLPRVWCRYTNKRYHLLVLFFRGSLNREGFTASFELNTKESFVRNSEQTSSKGFANGCMLHSRETNVCVTCAFVSIQVD